MHACARIGAIHSVVYAGMGAEALRNRIDDSGAEVLVCADATHRRGKVVDLKFIVDAAVKERPQITRVVVWSRKGVPPARPRDAERLERGRAGRPVRDGERRGGRGR